MFQVWPALHSYGREKGVGNKHKEKNEVGNNQGRGLSLPRDRERGHPYKKKVIWIGGEKNRREGDPRATHEKYCMRQHDDRAAPFIMKRGKDTPEAKP